MTQVRNRWLDQWKSSRKGTPNFLVTLSFAYFFCDKILYTCIYFIIIVSIIVALLVITMTMIIIILLWWVMETLLTSSTSLYYHCAGPWPQAFGYMYIGFGGGAGGGRLATCMVILWRFWVRYILVIIVIHWILLLIYRILCKTLIYVTADLLTCSTKC